MLGAAEGATKKESRSRQSLAKKPSARRNLRHGLAAISRHNPALWPEIERIAKAICNGDGNPLLFEQATVIAESEMVLRCMRLEKVRLIERLRDPRAKPLSRKDNSLARAKARFRLVKFRYKSLLQAKPNNVARPSGQGRNMSREGGSEAKQPRPTKRKKIRTRDEFDALRRALPDLERLARYERRAWSRRKRAIRELIAIKADHDYSENMQSAGRD
jgi:hypothetical protein